jgi:hypothetical protein
MSLFHHVGLEPARDLLWAPAEYWNNPPTSYGGYDPAVINAHAHEDIAWAQGICLALTAVGFACTPWFSKTRPTRLRFASAADAAHATEQIRRWGHQVILHRTSFAADHSGRSYHSRHPIPHLLFRDTQALSLPQAIKRGAVVIGLTAKELA